LEEIDRYGPDLLCYGTTTGLHRYYMQVNRYIKRHRRIFSVFGGMHATFVPEIVDDPDIDAACVGEGELALVELVNRLQAGQSVADVQNFHVKENGVVHRNPVRGLIQDLDTIGFPDRELIYANKTYANSPMKVFITSRGCIGRCSYCFHSGYGMLYDNGPGRYLRRRSVGHVIAEIDAVRRKYPLEFVHLTDDMFNFNRAWQEEFLREYKREINLPFSAIFMIDWTEPDLLALYKEAGCVNIRIAFETASDDIKKELERPKDTPTAKQLAAAQRIKDAGIRLTTLNMVGMPGGSVATELGTLQMNLLARPDQVLVNFIHPYPGTGLDSVLKAHGLTRKSYDEYDARATRFSPIDLENKEQVENIHHLFPLLVRYPRIMRIAPRLIESKGKLARQLYLLFYGLMMDLQVAELVHDGKLRARKRSSLLWELGRRLWVRVAAVARESVFSRRNPVHSNVAS
jgi:radical SAM superfamily enzyme YgiQ (UPF0313 family)